ncbi:MAG: hypothetical protein IJ796_04735 [Lachnospiraceae bacterium]|nr:hypothetical protein [Lachnospiraceae bacterium]
MLAIRVPDVKNFMNNLLAGNLFDPFLVIDGLLVTAITYTFDGQLNPAFYEDSEAPEYEYQPWSETKKSVFELIRGSHTPLHIRFSLMLKPEKAAEMLEKAAPGTDFSYLKALILGIKFENGAITLTTGTSCSTFVMSHDADLIWDKSIQKYLSAKGIEFELLT